MKFDVEIFMSKKVEVYGAWTERKTLILNAFLPRQIKMFITHASICAK